jgi:hypothetical protein
LPIITAFYGGQNKPEVELAAKWRRLTETVVFSQHSSVISSLPQHFKKLLAHFTVAKEDLKWKRPLDGIAFWQ